MTSTVLSVRVDATLKKQLDRLSKSTRRSRAWLAADAIEQYVRRNAWKAQELQTALAEADKGKFISHESMLAWVDSLGAKTELPPPKVDIQVPARRK